jgi:hypothetical protein
MRRTCRKWARRLSPYAAKDPLPEKLDRMLQANAELKTAWEADQRVAALIGLKRYEVREAGRAERCQQDVCRRLRTQVTEQIAAGYGWFMPASGYRLALAALLLLTVGINFYRLTPDQNPGLEWHPETDVVAAVEPDAPVPVRAEYALEERPNPDFRETMLSNWPARVSQSPYRFIGMNR